jgi:RimK family alpha-L-glutamate ligase
VQGAQHAALRDRPVEVEEPDLQFRGKPLSDYDAVMPRIGASITYFGSAVVRQFEQMDVYTPNTANGITNSRDKLRAIQILSRHDIGMPKTAFVRNRQDVLPAIERVGGAPVVIKLLEGTQGIGVILAPDRKVAEAIIETLHNTKQNVLIQEFIAESKGRDIRALVVGDRVVAAMRRTAQGDEFRSNVHRGGSVEPVVARPGVRADRGARRADHGAAGRRRRHARGQRRPDGDGGQLVARPRRHRARDRARRRRRDHRPRRQPGRVPRTRRPSAPHGQHGLRRRRAARARGRRLRGQDDRRVRACAIATSPC